VRPRPKPSKRVSIAPPPAFGILLLGAAAVLAAAGALIRFYARAHAKALPSQDAEVEIVAPDLETLPKDPQ
jgi:hypothetical protein